MGLISLVFVLCKFFQPLYIPNSSVLDLLVSYKENRQFWVEPQDSLGFCRANVFWSKDLALPKRKKVGWAESENLGFRSVSAALKHAKLSLWTGCIFAEIGEGHCNWECSSVIRLRFIVQNRHKIKSSGENETGKN